MRSKKCKVDSSVNQRPLVDASWNVRTLQDTGHEARRRTALTALSESRLPEVGSPVEVGTAYTFIWSGLPIDARRIHGVGFTARTALLQNTQESPITIDEQLMTQRLQLAKDCFATFVRVYAPTLDSSDDVYDR